MAKHTVEYDLSEIRYALAGLLGKGSVKFLDEDGHEIGCGKVQISNIGSPIDVTRLDELIRNGRPKADYFPGR